MEKTYYVGLHSSSGGRITSIVISPQCSDEALQEYYRQVQKRHLKNPLTRGGIEITMDGDVTLKGFTAFTQEGLPLSTEPGACGYHSPDGRIYRQGAKIEKVNITLERELSIQLATLIGGMVPDQATVALAERERFMAFITTFVQKCK